MPSPRRLFAVMSSLLIAGWVFGGPARGVDPAAPPPPPPDGPAVTVEIAGGETVDGAFGLATVRLRTAFGAADLDAGKLKALTFEPDENGGVTASADLRDQSHQSGPLLTDVLLVRVGGQTRTFRPAEVRRVTFHYPKDHSPVAIAVGLVTLTVMEIVLGVDNIIFLAIVAGKLPAAQQPRARRIGLLAALGTRLMLLATLSFFLGLTRPLFTLPPLPFVESAEARAVSWRDLILLAGGAFLIGKSVFEMHEKLEHAKAEEGGAKPAAKAVSFAGVIVQIALLDIIFSLDSVITAVGMVDELWVMMAAVLMAVGVMMVAAGPIARFVDRRPTIKVLALSFLILIGVLLVAEGLGQHLDKGYIYFAMAFAVGIELVNMRLRGSPSPVAGELPAGG